MGARQLFVLGVHRSGTSVLTETAVRLGLYGGEPEDLDAGDQWNERGYWEHRSVRALDEEILALADTEWFCAPAFDPTELPADRLNALNSKAAAILAALDARAPWVVKDPRLCVLLAFWLPLLPAPAFLFSLRGPLSVARSIRARDRFPLAVGVALWEVQLLAAIEATKGYPRTAFWYEDLVAAPEVEADRLSSWLRAEVGILADSTKIAPASDARFRHHLTDPREEALRLPPGARRLLDALRSGEAFDESFDVTPSEDAREMMEFVDREARTRRFLDRGWREQRAAHGDAIRTLEEMIRLKDAYISDLLKHIDRSGPET